MARRQFKTPFAATGDVVSIPDAVQPDGSVSMAQGFGFDYQRDPQTDPLAKVFPRDVHNGLLNEITASLGEIQGFGYPLWVAEGKPYAKGATVRVGDENLTSTIANNNNTPPHATWVAQGFDFDDVLVQTSGTATDKVMSQNAATKLKENALGGMGRTHTASATFTTTDNKIVMAGIVTALQLEVGDVIQFSNAIAQNNKPRTVESITDADTIIVNYEHCGSRGDGSLKLTNETVTGATVKLLSKWFVASDTLGREYVDLYAARSLGTIFKNQTPRAFSVYVLVSDARASEKSASLYINGSRIASTGVGSNGAESEAPYEGGVSAIATTGSEYRAEVATGGDILSKWWELR